VRVGGTAGYKDNFISIYFDIYSEGKGNAKIIKLLTFKHFDGFKVGKKYLDEGLSSASRLDVPSGGVVYPSGCFLSAAPRMIAAHLYQ
jgi:hypothetical protein